MTGMAKRRQTTYRLLDGQTVDLRGLTPREKSFLADLRRMIRDEIDFFEIERAAIGPGSPALGGGNRVDERLARTALYLAAEDIATRAGIEQGLILAPEHESKRAAARADRSMISVAQAADLIGVSRTAVYKAVEKGTLLAERIGNVTVVNYASALTYRERRSTEDERRSHHGATRAARFARRRVSRDR